MDAECFVKCKDYTRGFGKRKRTVSGAGDQALGFTHPASEYGVCQRELNGMPAAILAWMQLKTKILT